MQPKTQFIRLVYASRATFPVGQDHASLNADLARILMQSRRNNPAKGLVGALYYGDGCFFQCLEGPADAVDALYQRLPDDPRHRDLVVLSRDFITQPSFSTWAMKFVPNAAAVRQFLDRHKLATFDPYRFDSAMRIEMVRLLLNGSDASMVASSEGLKPVTLEEVHGVAQKALRFALMALTVSVIAATLAILL